MTFRKAARRFRAYFLRGHIKNLNKVLANCEKYGWKECEVETRITQNKMRRELSHLESD